MIVEIVCAETRLSRRARPDGVDTALTATVQRAVTITLVESYEERRSSSLESAAAKNIRHKALQIIVSGCDRRGANSASPPHIVTIIRSEPHEVRGRSRIEIVNQNTIRYGASAGIRKHELVAASRAS